MDISFFQKILFIILISFFVNLILTLIYINLAKKYSFFDIPENISVHKKKIITASGITFVITFQVLGIIYFFTNISDNLNFEFYGKFWIYYFSILLLGIFFFFDDIKKINPVYNLFFQTTILFLSIPLLNLNYFPFENYTKLNLIIGLYFWVYTINIINFTDGTDGFLSTNCLISFIAISLTEINQSNYSFALMLSLISIGIMISYLIFNKPPAKIFMGDTGSIILGFTLFVCSYKLLIDGYWYIVFSYIIYTYLDCTLTLINKILKGYLPWARLFDYNFLKPIKKNISNKSKVFYINLTYNLLILLIIILQLYFQLNYLFVLSFILALFKIKIYKVLGG